MATPNPQMPDGHDCIIVGGGPAGLYAGLYLARYRRRILVIDGGDSRARLIPRSNNILGWPEGVSGGDLMTRIQAHAERYQVGRLFGVVDAIVREDGDFVVRMGGTIMRSRAIIIATGVANARPPMADHDGAVANGLLRYCPVCHGYESIGQRIAILGHDALALNERAFLQTFTDDITLFACDASAATAIREAGGDAYGIVRDISTEGGVVQINSEDGSIATFNALYACLGIRPRSELAAALGVSLARDGAVPVDAHCRTNVEGVYAIGDVVSALDQVAVAAGHAAIAATAIHKWLRDKK